MELVTIDQWMFMCLLAFVGFALKSTFSKFDKVTDQLQKTVRKLDVLISESSNLEKRVAKNDEYIHVLRERSHMHANLLTILQNKNYKK